MEAPGSFLRLLRRRPAWPSVGRAGPRFANGGKVLTAKGQVHGNKPGLGVSAKEEIYKFRVSGRSEREDVGLFVGTLMKL